MPTYAQLQTEVWWTNEFQPPSLAELCRNLRDFFQVDAAALGSKGDNNHLYGYHRSRAWILGSAWSAYGKGDYSVQAAEDRAGDANWLAAVDFTPGDADTMVTVCQRLDAAVKAGLTPQLREWYGNVDGDQIVDGWDLLADRAASSDSSHLWHLHMSFLRGRAGDDHSNLFAILTGQTEEDDMGYDRNSAWLLQNGVLDLQDPATIPADDTEGSDVQGQVPNKLAAKLNEILAAAKAAGTPTQEQVTAAVKAALLDPAVVKVLNDAAFAGSQRAERE